MEDTILRKWIKNTFIYWPVGISAMRALREKRYPTEDWKMFKLLKIKVESGKSNVFSFCFQSNCVRIFSFFGDYFFFCFR